MDKTKEVVMTNKKREHVTRPDYKMQIRFGAFAPSLKQQLRTYKVDAGTIEHFQLDADAVVRVSIRGVITEADKVRAHKRLFAAIKKHVLEHNNFTKLDEPFTPSRASRKLKAIIKAQADGG